MRTKVRQAPAPSEDGLTAKVRRLPAVHPGEVLLEDLMTPLGLSINGLARDLRVPVTRLSQIVNCRRSITADTALRLARYFGMTPQFWMNLQGAHNLDVATRTSADRIKRDVHPRARTDVREWFAALDSFGPEPFPDVRPTRAERRRR